jgi:hypothetical protein
MAGTTSQRQSKAEIRADNTTLAATIIIHEERKERQRKNERLRAARLKHERRQNASVPKPV